MNIRQFTRNETGATAIEYALIAAIVSIVIVVGLNLVGGQTSGMFTGVAEQVGAANL